MQISKTDTPPIKYRNFTYKHANLILNLEIHWIQGNLKLWIKLMNRSGFKVRLLTLNKNDKAQKEQEDQEEMLHHSSLVAIYLKYLIFKPSAGGTLSF